MVFEYLFYGVFYSSVFIYIYFFCQGFKRGYFEKLVGLVMQRGWWGKGLFLGEVGLMFDLFFLIISLGFWFFYFKIQLIFFGFLYIVEGFGFVLDGTFDKVFVLFMWVLSFFFIGLKVGLMEGVLDIVQGGFKFLEEKLVG